MPAIAAFAIPESAAGSWVEVLDGASALPAATYLVSSELYECQFCIADAAPTPSSAGIPALPWSPVRVTTIATNKLYVRGIVGTVIDVVPA